MTLIKHCSYMFGIIFPVAGMRKSLLSPQYLKLPTFQPTPSPSLLNLGTIAYALTVIFMDNNAVGAADLKGFQYHVNTMLQTIHYQNLRKTLLFSYLNDQFYSP